MAKYKWEEIAKHTEQDDCWIVISNKVIDVTSFLKQHPGGRWIILEYAGKDATQAFQNTIHSEVALQKMYELYIGDV